MKNRVELRDYIRYQLSQLGARNGEHEFELLSFELARLRQVSNLQPATGPVKAGGDQGRDFESYRTYLAGTRLARSTFVALASNDVVVGACTLDKKTPAKIRNDLKLIFGSGERPNIVLYYCEPNIPVAKRHELQSECKFAYSAALNVFDGLAIADQLSSPDTFWIAEKYLSVPAEFYPKEEIGAAYELRRKRWINNAASVNNYADFLDIKLGLRTAFDEEAAKPDLAGWLSRMREIADQDDNVGLKQKARYEISVAELRGRGNLDPALPYVEAFFRELNATTERPSNVLDASVLVIYCWGAFGLQQTSASFASIKSYFDKVSNVISFSLANTTRQGDHCTLLEARAMLAAFPQSGVSHEVILQGLIDAWHDVVNEVKEVPIFPISHIADLVEIFAPLMGQFETFRGLRDEIDRLSNKRAGAHEVADRSRRRAIKQLEAGNRLAAIDELHRAKVGSFTGDETPNSISAMLLLSKCYTDLDLHIAARYYAAGAMYAALHTEDENVYRLLSHSGFDLVQTFYTAGECVNFLLILNHVIRIHLTITQDPMDIAKHVDLQRAIIHGAIFKVVAHRLAPQLDRVVSAAISAWPLNIEDTNELMAPAASADSPWTTMSVSEIEDSIERDLGRSPFSDIGDPREISWSALGIRWTVRHAADKTSTLAALELVATLQIAQVELADVELLIIPTNALILIETAEVEILSLKQLPSNDCMTWKAVLPAEWTKNEAGLRDGTGLIIGVAAAVIGEATALDYHAFKSVVDESFERGLAHRIFSVRPARELMDFVLAHAEGAENLRTLERVRLSRRIKLQEASELAWKSTPGPGYSREKAEEFLANRYRRTSEIIQLSLPEILADERIKILLFDLKSRGFLDWQILAILANIVGQYQVEANGSRPFDLAMKSRFEERMSRPERPDDIPFDLRVIDKARLEGQAAVLIPAAFRTWGLSVNRQTPNLLGMKRLLDERYGHSNDDIVHVSLFPTSE